MAAFDKVKSGISQLDEILDYIRMGDNVVWEVSDVEEFRMLMTREILSISGLHSILRS